MKDDNPKPPETATELALFFDYLCEALKKGEIGGKSVIHGRTALWWARRGKVLCGQPCNGPANGPRIDFKAI